MEIIIDDLLAYWFNCKISGNSGNRLKVS